MLGSNYLWYDIHSLIQKLWFPFTLSQPFIITVCHYPFPLYAWELTFFTALSSASLIQADLLSWLKYDSNLPALLPLLHIKSDSVPDGSGWENPIT